jgi:phosphate:Na+ symporter
VGFALTFYGLNLVTNGLRPLRGTPEVMQNISALRADSFGGLLICSPPRR